MKSFNTQARNFSRAQSWARRAPQPVPYERIKKSAQRLFDAQVNELLAMVHYADGWGAQPGIDNICFAALARNPTLTEKERRVCLQQTREAGLRAIGDWDVRLVGDLLKLYPRAAPGLADRPLVCYVADNDKGDWMVCAAD